MTHAAQTFGIEQADKQMGWWLFIAEGLCYISGAIIYAVSLLPQIEHPEADAVSSFAYQKDFVPDGSTSGVARTRSSISVPLAAPPSTLWVCSRRSTTTMIR